MKNGFTLIELLVSIAILGLIMMIAIPRIGDVINESKNNAYLETVSTIENAAQLYRIRNLHEFSDVVGEKRVVTIKQLQDAGFLKSNIQDPRYGTTITDGDVFVVLQSNGEYTYTHTNASYVKDNLVLWYDALWHGDNQNTWIDRSGNNLNGTLLNFDHNGSSGWQSTGLLFDGINDYVTTSPIATQTNLTFEFMFKRTNTGYVTWTKGNDTIIVYNTGNAYIKSNSGNASIGATYTLPINNYYLISITYNISTQKARYYLNGSYIREATLPASSATFAFANGQNLFANYNATSFGSGEMYSHRFYSKALSDDEIKQNYLTDKERFNF